MQFAHAGSSAVNMVQAQELDDMINSVREHVKEVTDGKPHLQFFCDDACIMRFLRARGMDPKKASVMLSDTLKWCALCNLPTTASQLAAAASGGESMLLNPSQFATAPWPSIGGIDMS